MTSKTHIQAISLVLILLALSSPAAAGQKSEKVDAIFAPWNKPDSPGCALAVIHNGRTIYEKGYGQANLEHNIPITPHSVFYIGSVSKQFTAMCIALLIDQGKLSLEDDIHQYIPELQDFSQPVKIRHLIFHTSGLRDYLTLLGLAGIPFGSYHEKEVLGLLSRQKELNFTPGTEYLYSNSGYFLLSVIVKRVSGQSLGDFAQENIFKPLGMTHSLFLEDYSRIIPQRAAGYFPEGKEQFKNYISTYDCVGAGGLYTSTQDLALWMDNFSHGKVGGKELLEWLQTPGKLDSGKELPYGFALSLSTYKGLKTVGHGGALGGYRAAVLRFPAQNFSVICLANLSTINSMRLAQQVADIYLAGQFQEEKEKPISKSRKKTKTEKSQELMKLTTSQLQEYAGAYYSEELQRTFQIGHKKDKLVFTHQNAPDLLFIYRDQDQFSAGNLKLHFLRDQSQKISGFTLDAGRVRNLRFIRRD